MNGFDRAQREYESRFPDDRHCNGCEDLQERIDNLEEDHKVELEILRKQNERLKIALKFYSAENDWDFYCGCCADGTTKLELDHGELARKALKECEEIEDGINGIL